MSTEKIVEDLNEVEKEILILRGRLRELGYRKSKLWNELMKTPEIREIYWKAGQYIKEELEKYLERKGLVR